MRVTCFGLSHAFAGGFLISRRRSSLSMARRGVWVSLDLAASKEERRIGIRARGVVETFEIKKTDQMYVDQMSTSWKPEKSENG